MNSGGILYIYISMYIYSARCNIKWFDAYLLVFMHKVACLQDVGNKCFFV